MSLDAIPGNVLRELFSLIGHNIAGDAQVPLPVPTSPSATIGNPQQPSMPAFGMAPVEADTSFPPSVSLAGLREPAATDHRPDMQAAIRTALARLASAQSGTGAAAPATLSSGAITAGGTEGTPEEGAQVPSDAAANPRPPVFQPIGSPSSSMPAMDFAFADAPLADASPMDEAPVTTMPTSDPSHVSADLGATAPGMQKTAMLQAMALDDIGRMQAETLQDAKAGDQTAAASSSPAVLSTGQLTGQSIGEAASRDPTMALQDRELVDAQVAARMGKATPDSLDLRFAVLSLASALQQLMPEDIQRPDGMAADLFPAPAQTLQAERAGVIASFILNAAMIPGWPPPRPIEGVPVAISAFALKQKELTDAERDLLLHLGKLLHSPETLRKLLRKVSAGAKRSKLMAALDFILTVMDDVTALLMAELERLEDLIRDDQGGPRHRLRLR